MSMSIKRATVSPEPVCIPIGHPPYYIEMKRAQQAERVLATNPQPMEEALPEGAEHVGEYTQPNGPTFDLHAGPGADGSYHLYASRYVHPSNPAMGMLSYQVVYDLGEDRAARGGC
jgi:hypothetical protein